MAGDVIRAQAPGPKHGVRRGGNREKRRLLVLCELELFFWPFKTQSRQRKSQRLVSSLENARCFREGFGEALAHSGELRALPGKQEGSLWHEQGQNLDCTRRFMQPLNGRPRS